MRVAAFEWESWGVDVALNLNLTFVDCVLIAAAAVCLCLLYARSFMLLLCTDLWPPEGSIRSTFTRNDGWNGFAVAEGIIQR